MNMRWDAAVEANAFWSDASPSPAAPATPAGEPVEVQVWLFGMLAASRAERPCKLRLAAGCSLRDVIGELGRRLEPDLLRHIVDERGEPFGHCRVFVDGMQAERWAAPIRGGGSPTTVEIILLVAAEGG